MLFSNLLVLEARPGSERDLELLLTDFTLHCRGQAGCVRCDCFQSYQDGARFMLQLQWRGADSLAVHLSSKVLREFFAKGGEVWRGLTVEAEYRNFTQEA